MNLKKLLILGLVAVLALSALPTGAMAAKKQKMNAYKGSFTVSSLISMSGIT